MACLTDRICTGLAATVTDSVCEGEEALAGSVAGSHVGLTATDGVEEKLQQPWQLGHVQGSPPLTGRVEP